MKALNVLNESKRAICIFIDSFDEESKEDDEYTSSIKYLEEINEAIKELEDFKNRSCVTCKYGHLYSDKYIECSNSKTETEGLEFEKDFYCKNWEQK